LEFDRLNGVVAATITPVDAAFEPDLPRLVAHCRRLLARGCDGINLLGTTGEAASFSTEQRRTVMRGVAESGLPLERFLVGTGAAALDDAVLLTRESMNLGYHGALVIPPFYYKNVDAAGIFAYYETLIERVDAAGLRLYLYHFPAMSGVAFDVPLVKRLVQAFPQTIAGIKDSSGELAFSHDVVRALPQLEVFPSSETVLAGARGDGFAGCISATANVTSPLAATVWEAALRGPTAVPAADADALVTLRSTIASASLIAAIKYVVADLASDAELARVHPPLSPLTSERAAELMRSLHAVDAFASLPRGK
jgi:4-hydroxy-tetrahydrodipicolinate synthase